MRPPPDAKSPRPVSRRGLKFFDAKFMQVICPTCQIFRRRVRDQRHLPAAEADPHLAPYRKQPCRVVSVEPAELVIERRPRWLVWILRIDARQSSDPIGEASREIWRAGGTNWRCRHAGVDCRRTGCSAIPEETARRDEPVLVARRFGIA